MTLEEVKKHLYTNKLNDEDIQDLIDENIELEDIIFFNDNIDLYYSNTYFSEIEEERGLTGVIEELKKTFEEIEEENTKSTVRSFGSIPYMQLTDSLKSLEFDLNLGGLLRGQVFSTYYKFYKELKKLDLRKIVKFEDKSIKVNKSNIIVNNVSLNIVDLIKIKYRKVNNYVGMNITESLTGCSIIESKMIKDSQSLLVDCKRVIDQFREYVSKEVFDYWENYLYILQAFLDSALFHLNPITSKSSRSLFFESNRKLAQRGRTNRDKINKAINAFATVGFLVKIDKKDIPVKLRNNSKKYAERLARELGQKSSVNEINFYSWVDLTNFDNLKYIEIITKKLIENDVKLYNFTQDSIINVLPTDIVYDVYGDTDKKVKKAVKNRLKNKKYQAHKSEYIMHKLYNHEELSFDAWYKKYKK